MKLRLLGVLLVASCSTLGDQAPLTPEIFGPGTVSTRGREFATSFSPDQRSVYVNRVEDGQILLVRCDREGGGWGPQQSVPFSDGSYPVVDPFISPDGFAMYFSSSGPDIQGDRQDFALWYTELDGGEWSADVTRIVNLDHPGSDVFCTLDHRGDLIYSTRAQDAPRVLMRAVATESGWRTPTKIAIPGLPAEASLGNPLIAHDGKLPRLHFGAFPSASGSVDLYLCKREAGGWSPPILLPEPINSEWRDFAPALSQDGKAFFFTSERPGMVAEPVEGRRPGDIYWVHVSALGIPLIRKAALSLRSCAAKGLSIFGSLGSAGFGSSLRDRPFAEGR